MRAILWIDFPRNPFFVLYVIFAVNSLPACSVSGPVSCETDADIQTLSTQLELYKAQNSFYPTTAQALQALVVKPAAPPIPASWQQLITRVPNDPWGHPYLYQCPGIHNPSGYDLSSAGPDGKPGTADDTSNW